MEYEEIKFMVREGEGQDGLDNNVLPHQAPNIQRGMSNCGGEME
jgi:hypothetical protein